MQFWVYTREYNLVTDQEVTPWTRVLDPATVCLGPEEAAAVDPEVILPGLVHARFKHVLKKGITEVSPRPDTLVNIPTVFRTSTPATYSVNVGELLPGFNVEITATAQSYTWYFGDGSSASSTAPEGRIEHRYRTAAVRAAQVEITWSGTFSVNGGQPRAINGTADSVGLPISVTVKQARSELVRD